ncbi:MAG TPA: hypothetical protein VHG08_17740 [Longimicrobium sp.]|nr:hypothetical protein [Longimicrobium sp.]
MKEAAEAQNWKGADLFPQYGMPSFPTPPAPMQLSVPVPVLNKAALHAGRAGLRPPAHLRPAPVPASPRGT